MEKEPIIDQIRNGEESIDFSFELINELDTRTLISGELVHIPAELDEYLLEVMDMRANEFSALLSRRGSRKSIKSGQIIVTNFDNIPVIVDHFPRLGVGKTLNFRPSNKKLLAGPIRTSKIVEGIQIIRPYY